ncbi:MAG: M42 family metallopeptidase, partial [Bdellovibrionales bacterium]|nr:M42 family metallopeptidase [Bdellovibrionales bacterium]
FEVPIQRVVRQRMKEYADYIQTDLHGNLILGMNVRAKKKIMLAGHCDQIGFMVRHIDKKGFIYVSKLGGIDSGVVPGAVVTLHCKKGPVAGVFGRKPIHQQSSEERSKGLVDLSKAWIDIGAKDDKEAKKLVEIGDPVTFELRVHELGPDLLCSPGMDDKVGLFVVLEAFRLCARSKLNVALYSVSTVQEEVGLRGARTAAYGIDPEVGIAVDVTHASDNPASDGAKEPPCELGKGPGIYSGPNINPVVYNKLVDSARKGKIPYQHLPSSSLLGNDANAMQVTRAGVAAASIGIPNRYMHTQVEVCSLKDLENSAKLLAGFVKSVSAGTSFQPR